MSNCQACAGSGKADNCEDCEECPGQHMRPDPTDEDVAYWRDKYKDEEKRWCDLAVQLAVQLATELAARKRADRAEAALTGIRALFADPSPFYIKKLGGPITNEDQTKIDQAFMAIEAALESK
jgi:hypothetical protein